MAIGSFTLRIKIVQRVWMCCTERNSAGVRQRTDNKYSTLKIGETSLE
jgi:hypothetical protein